MRLPPTIPTRPLARGGQVFGEEGVQTEVAVEFQSEPATAPLLWTMERKLIQTDLHDARVIRGRGPVMREQGEGLRRGVALGLGVERLAPGGALRIIDLAQVKHLPLGDAAIGQPFVFHHTPISVLLAVFFVDLRSQKHSGRRAYTRIFEAEEGRSSLQALWREDESLLLGIPRASTPKTVETEVESAKSG